MIPTSNNANTFSFSNLRFSPPSNEQITATWQQHEQAMQGQSQPTVRFKKPNEVISPSDASILSFSVATSSFHSPPTPTPQPPIPHPRPINPYLKKNKPSPTTIVSIPSPPRKRTKVASNLAILSRNGPRNSHLLPNIDFK